MSEKHKKKFSVIEVKGKELEENPTSADALSSGVLTGRSNF